MSSKKVIFSKHGQNNVTFFFYESINMAQMFKNISNLISVKMISEKNAKILSLESAFESCTNLEIIEINGFDTREIESLKKIFSLTKKFTNN